MNQPYLDFPFGVDSQGQAARTDRADHIRDMIEQVLFTGPGERINRPEFGCGLRQLVFMANSDALATATQHQVHGALDRWLGDVIQIDEVNVTFDEERLIVEVVYIRRDTGERRQELFSSPTGGS